MYVDWHRAFLFSKEKSEITLLSILHNLVFIDSD
jgi:hypothetical protein